VPTGQAYIDPSCIWVDTPTCDVARGRVVTRPSCVCVCVLTGGGAGPRGPRGAAGAGAVAVEVGHLVGVHPLDVHLVGLGGLLQLGQDQLAAALGRRVHLKHLDEGTRLRLRHSGTPSW